MRRTVSSLIIIAILCFTTTIVYATKVNYTISFHKTTQSKIMKKEIPKSMTRFTFDSGLHFQYPEAVRGIYVSGQSAGSSKFKELLSLVQSTDLNAMVIDIKNDSGYMTYLPKGTKYLPIGRDVIKNPRSLLKELEQKQIYPIARIVVFKDTVLATKRPDLSFRNKNQLWRDVNGEAFVNPFLKEVWDYNIGIAIEAAKLGFQEIQFDYVRFPAGFEKMDQSLTYSMGEYKKLNKNNVQKRVEAVTDFVQYAKEQLKPYNVKISVDIFGYSATIPEAPGIGQNFSRISEHVDVISSMIYPSHWGSYFGISKPDLEPYQLVTEYAKVENKRLKQLKERPISRPWIQDFTASWLGKGNYKVYGINEIEAQIKALKSQGINEYLIWNAGNTYTKGVDYTP